MSEMTEITHCPKCGTEVKHAGGIGDFCPNRECDVSDNLLNWDKPHLQPKVAVHCTMPQAELDALCDLAYSRGRASMREEADRLIREKWHAAVKKHNLVPGSLVEAFASEVLNGLRALKE